MRNLYNPEILSTMTDETFFCNGLTFRFNKKGEVVDTLDGSTYPSMRQFFLANGDSQARPCNAIAEDGTPFPEVYESYALADTEWDIAPEYEIPEPTSQEPSRLEIANEILDNWLNGTTTLAGAVDAMFDQVKQKCGLPETFITKLDTIIKMAKLAKI